ncbi:MAG: FHA domain-containing protein [Thermoanaerobaculaceae bacterium]|nr:FHA domain-containing protein [Thermoanaerobaculaceae bacterium]
MDTQRVAPSAGAQDFHLGDWLVQPSLNQVCRGSEARLLEPKVMDVLVCVAAGGGALVAKTHIIDEVWATRFVCESVLSRAIAEIRRTLGDSASAPRYLATVTKRGYRVVAPVMPCGTGEPHAGTSEASYVLVVGDREITLAEGETLIGRDHAVAVRINSLDVSRRHARIVVWNGGARLEDLGSRNGTFLRGRRLDAAAELADGDEIVVGGVFLTFRRDQSSSTTEALGHG